MSAVAEQRKARSSLIGASAPRKEDDRLLRGDGCFADDLQLAHQLEMAVGRCPFPHAEIRSIDVTPALAQGGGEQKHTGAEVRAVCAPRAVFRPVARAPALP
ncbi:MAG: xanthine dehydrogenase family protein molybdopterin-binding subunit, partial [Alphaproteobacteria bacterium]|nr:xanthine dehydrogenase family protein molybdopterin-binding subunit [Alphaproteobacteria bacterium]